MPVLGDPIDERIRAVLEQTPMEPVDLTALEEGSRRRARRLGRRRRATMGAVGLAVVAIFGSVLSVATDDAERVETEPAQSSSTFPTPTYGFAPLTPLLDEPLSIIPPTEITRVEGRTLSVSSDSLTLGLQLSDDIGSGSVSGKAMNMPAIVTGATGPSDQQVTGPAFVFGMTRPEVAGVEVTVNGVTHRSDTLAHRELPQLRFFLVAVDELPQAPFQVAAFDANGMLLTDKSRIRSEHAAFEQAMDDRAGVEPKRAAIVGAEITPDGHTILLTLHTCGAEPNVEWTEDRTAVSVSATVKLPYAHGDCTDGPTVQHGIGLEVPVGSRSVVDADTGQQLL